MKIITGPWGTERSHFFPDILREVEGLAFISTCCLRAKLVAWCDCSLFSLWFPWEIQRIVDRFIVIQQLVCLLLCSSADPKCKVILSCKSHFLLTSYTLICWRSNPEARKSRKSKVPADFVHGTRRKKWAQEAFQATALLWSKKSVSSVFMYENNKKRIVERRKLLKHISLEINAIKCPVHLVTPLLSTFPPPLPLKPISESSVCLSKFSTLSFQSVFSFSHASL